MTPVVLAYLAKAKFGGWPTFLKHLHAALRSAGTAPVVRTLGARTALMPHDFGHGLMARKLRMEDLLRMKAPVIVAAADKDHAEQASQLVRAGALIVVHDPAEKHLAGVPTERTIVIRRSMKQRLPGSHFIPHPYERAFRTNPQRSFDGQEPVAHSRIDFDKYTHLILEANDLGAGIRITGAPNPMYVHFKIHPRWPDFKAEPFPRDRHAGAELCARASTVVDMSAIKNDGGGSQYSFLEAWDAQTPLVINRKWTDGFPDDEMQHGVNCLAARDGAEIHAAVSALRSDPELAMKIVRAGEESLAQHDAGLIGLQYRRLLGV